MRELGRRDAIDWMLNITVDPVLLTCREVNSDQGL